MGYFRFLASLMYVHYVSCKRKIQRISSEIRISGEASPAVARFARKLFEVTIREEAAQHS